MRRYFLLGLSAVFALTLVVILIFSTARPLSGAEGRGVAPALIEEEAPPIRVAQPQTVNLVFSPPAAEFSRWTLLVEGFADLLAQKADYEVYAFIAGCPAAAAEDLGNRQVDFGFLPSFTYAGAHDQFGLEATIIAMRFNNPAFRGQFLVRADSGIDTIADLAGLNVVYPDPASTSGYLAPSYEVYFRQGVPSDVFFGQELFDGGHPGTVQAVYDGQYEGMTVHGGATYWDARDSLAEQIPDIYSQLKVIAFTSWIPNDAVAARPGLDSLVMAIVSGDLLKAINSPEGNEKVNELYSWEGGIPIGDAPYQVTRDLAAYHGLEQESCSVYVTVTPAAGDELIYTGTTGFTTTVTLPAGFAETTRLSLSPIPAITYRPVETVESGAAFRVTAVVSDTGQPLATAPAPFTIQVEYAEEAVPPEVAAGLVLYYWDGSAWAPEPSSVHDPLGHTVTATSDRFTQWALLSEQSLGVIEVWAELQGRDSHAGSEICVLDGGSPIACETTPFNGYGRFYVPEGSYTVTVESMRYLDAQRTAVPAVTGQSTQLPVVTLLGGDAVEDDIVDILDLTLLGGQYGLVCDDPAWDGRADINNDCAVNIIDLTLAGSNYGLESPVPWP